MKKFRVYQQADYVQGHLRYGHREGIIEAESKEDVLNKLNEGHTDFLDLEIDDYSVYDADYGDNKFEIEEVTEENNTDITENIMNLIEEFAKVHDLAKKCGSEYISQDDNAQVDSLELVCNIFDLYANRKED